MKALFIYRYWVINFEIEMSMYASIDFWNVNYYTTFINFEKKIWSFFCFKNCIDLITAVVVISAHYFLVTPSNIVCTIYFQKSAKFEYDLSIKNLSVSSNHLHSFIYCFLIKYFIDPMISYNRKYLCTLYY